MLPEALVVESLLRAQGICTTTAGKDIVPQCPQLAILFDGISILVDESNFAAARALIDDAEDVPGYKSSKAQALRRIRCATPCWCS
jgi:hypothetical protein